MEEKKEWINYGDVNFLAYGGCLVAPHWDKATLEEHPDFADQFDVFQLITEAGDNCDQMLARLFMVTVGDYEDSKKDILYAIGLEDKADLPMDKIIPLSMWAKEIVEYGCGEQGMSYDNPYACQFEDYVISKEDLKKWLTDLGAADVIHLKEDEK